MIDIKVVTETTIFDSLEEQWKALVSISDTYIYQTFEWNRTWWKHYGTEGNLYLILFYSDNRLVGIAPLFLDIISLFGRKLYSCLRFLGSNVSQPKEETLLGLMAYSDYLNIVVEPGYEDQISRHLADHFTTGNLSCDEILFEEVPERSMILSHLVPVLKENRKPVVIEDSSSCVNILLDKSWDEYLGRKSKKSRSKTRRYLRKVEDKDQKIFDVQTPENPDELAEVFETLVRLHQEQWNNKGFPGTFYKKRMYEFTKEITFEFFQNGWLQIKKLTAVDDNTPVSSDMFFMYNKRIYYMHGGMNDQSPLLTKGAGHIIFNVALKEAIEKKYEVFDFMRGLQEYKQWKGDIVTTNKLISIQHSVKKGRRRINSLKRILRIQRRLRVEAIQFALFFKEKNLVEGIRTYLLFISQRIKTKKTSLSKTVTL